MTDSREEVTVIPDDEELVEELCEMQNVGSLYNPDYEHVLSYKQRTEKIAAYRTQREQAARDERDATWTRTLWPCDPTGEGKALTPEEALEWYGEIVKRCEQNARDATARKAFAALCWHCRCGLIPARASEESCYFHKSDEAEHRGVCHASDLRLVLDPDGRLAESERTEVKP